MFVRVLAVQFPVPTGLVLLTLTQTAFSHFGVCMSSIINCILYQFFLQINNIDNIRMPIISLKHKFIIILNPKCASTYLERVFRNYNDYPRKIYKHHKAELVRKILEEDGHNYEEFFVVIVTRNPFDHAISGYYQDMVLYIKNRGNSAKNNEKHNKYINDINAYILNEKIRHYPGLKKMICENNNTKCIVNKIFRINEIKKLINLFEKKYNIKLERVTRIINKKQLNLFSHDYKVEDFSEDAKKKIESSYAHEFLFLEDNLYYERNENLIKLI